MSEVEPKLGTSTTGEPMHYSVGALIKRDGKYLLVDRAFEPFGFAGLGGHIDEGEEDRVAALSREVFEESGLTQKDAKLLIDKEVIGNKCKRGINVHYWYLYEVEAEGNLVWNEQESHSIDWYGVDEIKKLNLEPIWEYWFKELKII